MRGVTLDFSRKRLVERSLPHPPPLKECEVLVHVTGVGVCGTDRLLANFKIGAPPPGDDFLVLGHEAVGRVVATGAHVKTLQAGDHVVPTVRRSCQPPCKWCSSARRDLCVTGQYSERGILRAHGYLQEFTVDREEDLIRVPPAATELSVLLEPLSVVEKAVARALELHAGEPGNALVLGAGTIGLLAAMILQLRGLSVDVCSLEAPGSRRAELVEQTGARYLNAPDRQFDVVIEAAGAADAAGTGVRWLAPLGVLMVLGAHAAENLPLLPLILGNCIIAGSVNASPQAFQQAVVDLQTLPAHVLCQMVRVREWPEAIAVVRGLAAEEPKQMIRMPD